MNKFLMGIAASFLLVSTLGSGAIAESRKEAKGEQLEQKGEQLEKESQKQVSEGHPLRAGRDAKKGARKEARGERKLKKSGAEESTPTTTTPAQ